MLKLILRLALSALLLVYFGFQVDWGVMYWALCGVHIRMYFISTAIALSGVFFMACKYHLLIRGTPLSLSVLRLLVIHYISRFYALLLPTALGPEAVRWYKVTKGKQEKTFFLAATVYERILFLLVLFGCGIVPLLGYQDNQQVTAFRDRVLPIVGGLGVVLILGLLYLMWPRFQKSVKSAVQMMAKSRKTPRLNLFFDNLMIKDRSFLFLFLMLALTFCWQGFFIFRIFFLFQSMGLEFGMSEAAWMGSLVLLLQVLPLSFAGLGVREGAYAYLFTLLGFSAEKGFLMGILFFSQMLVFVAIGAVLNMFEK